MVIKNREEWRNLTRKACTAYDVKRVKAYEKSRARRRAERK